MFLEKERLPAGEKRVRIKICGITRVEDALLAANLGADAVGFVFYEKSPRFISPLAAAKIVCELPPLVSAVGLFVNATQQQIDATLAVCPLDVLQLHGDETAEFCAAQTRRVMKAVAIRQAADVEAVAAYACPVLLDAKAPSGVYGGAGKVFDWSLVAGLQHTHPLLLAGGLDAGNVDAALNVRHWHALDVSSGVESAPGIKDAEKLRRFMAHMQASGTADHSNGGEFSE